MLTKDDTLFIKDIILSKIEKMKTRILKSATHRNEILEGEKHIRCEKTRNERTRGCYHKTETGE